MVGPFFDVELAAWTIGEQPGAVGRQHLQAALVVAAEDEVPRVARRALGADECRAGWNQGGVAALVGGCRSGA